MSCVSLNDMVRAFATSGWLDKVTGEIIECPVIMVSKYKYRYDIPQYMLENKQRYIRIPHIDNVQVVIDFIEDKLPSASMLDEYGLTRVKREDATYLRCAGYDEIKDGDLTEEECRFLSDFRIMLEMDDKLENEFDEYGRPLALEIITKWFNDQHCYIS